MATTGTQGTFVELSSRQRVGQPVRGKERVNKSTNVPIPPRRARARFPPLVDIPAPTGYPSPTVGPWRSLVAHLNGVQGVASSNLAGPTST
jgi:hypothetical protein